MRNKKRSSNKLKMAVMLASREFTKFFMELQCLENTKHGTLKAYDENNCLELDKTQMHTDFSFNHVSFHQETTRISVLSPKRVLVRTLSGNT